MFGDNSVERGCQRQCSLIAVIERCEIVESPLIFSNSDEVDQSGEDRKE